MFYIISFSITALLLYLLTWFLPPDCPWSFWWRTDKRVARTVARLAKINKKDVVYELGSGDGEFAVTIAKEYKTRVVGIEIDIVRFLISKIRAVIWGVSNATFIREDFKKISLKDATVVYFYLVPQTNKKILPKLKRELKKGTRVISYRYPLPELKPLFEEKNHKIYGYVV